MKPKKNLHFFSKSIFESLRCAFSGLWDVARTEHNAWFHAMMTVLTLGLGFRLQIGTLKFCLIVIAIVMVWLAETINTVFEIVVDIVSPQYSEGAKRAKDIAAAAVLIASLGAFILGLMVLGPPLYNSLTR